MNTDWKDAVPASNLLADGPQGRWFVKVCPRDKKRETAVRMWRLLEAMGATRDQVERINDHSFKVWVNDKATGEAWRQGLIAAFGR